jgi:Protein of unknown function (DUF4197)
MKKIIVAASLIVITIAACTTQQLQQTADAAKTVINSTGTTTGGTGTTTGPLTNDEVVKGLREALTVGANNSSAFASKLDGFYKNPAMFIPFPPEAQKVKDWATKLGMGAEIDKFEMTLNRSAEEATKNAGTVFANAIKGMSISDGFAILKGANNAATQFLKDKTTTELKTKFTPVVQSAIDKVELTKYWSPIITAYNKVPLIEKQNPNLTDYVTDRAMIGLFKLVEQEELKIRKDPVAQVSAILKRVFGSLLTQ